MCDDSINRLQTAGLRVEQQFNNEQLISFMYLQKLTPIYQKYSSEEGTVSYVVKRNDCHCNLNLY